MEAVVTRALAENMYAAVPAAASLALDGLSIEEVSAVEGGS
jgi:hypothetical protein